VALEEDEVVGILTERDLLKRVVSQEKACSFFLRLRCD
jgi:CBS domain-containing protein